MHSRYDIGSDKQPNKRTNNGIGDHIIHRYHANAAGRTFIHQQVRPNRDLNDQYY